MTRWQSNWISFLTILVAISLFAATMAAFAISDPK